MAWDSFGGGAALEFPMTVGSKTGLDCVVFPPTYIFSPHISGFSLCAGVPLAYVCLRPPLSFICIDYFFVGWCVCVCLCVCIFVGGGILD